MNAYSLLELTSALALLAVASSAVVPAAGRHRDHMDVLAAREALVAALRDTRAEALRAGGASLRLTAAEGHALVVVGDSVVREVRLSADGRVTMSFGGSRSEAEIPYNGLGLGVFANETIELTAGSARARLMVSAYGRVRRE